MPLLKIKIYILVCFLLCGACSFRDSEITKKSQNPSATIFKSSDNSRNLQKSFQSNSEQISSSEKKNIRYQTKLSRKKIRFPEDCQYVIGLEDEYQLERTCAAAIESVLPDLPREDCAYKSYLEKNNLLDFTKYSTEYHPGAVKFYPLSAGNFLVEIQCWNSAYNVSNVYLRYDESSIPATARILEFPSFSFTGTENSDKVESVKKTVVNTVNGVYFNRKTKELIAFVKGLGIGDSGTYAKYSFVDGDPKLREFRADFKDGCPCYQTDQVIKESPKKWKRYYP